MALTNYKLGELIELVLETNSANIYGPVDVRGMTITKEIIPTKADVGETDLSKFLIVRPGEFIYNPRTHGRKIGFGYNNTANTFIISWNNIAFRVKPEMKSVVLPDYLFLHFKRDEWDREACFQSWGSSTEVFSWETLCDMKVDLPSLSIQKKYVDVYNAMLANQKSYERGLEDLKLTCDAFIENLRGNYESRSLISMLKRRNERNDDVSAEYLGISKEGFISPKQELSDGNILHKKKFYFDDFIFTPSGVNVHNKIYNTAVCSHVNEMFFNSDSAVLSDYIELWLKRDEFLRYCDFYNISSVMANFNYDTFSDYSIPIPPIELQQSIVSIYKAYLDRKAINEQLKSQVQNICPILIKGSLEEAMKEA